MAKPANRVNDLAAIHIAQKALGLSADDALALKLQVVKVGSAADMTAEQRRRYLAHLSGLQARTAAAKGQAAGYAKDRPARDRTVDDPNDDRWHKARALWIVLARAGHVRIDTDAALMAYVKRQTRVEHWRFLNTAQVNNVIEALKRWCVRTGVEFDRG